LKNLVILGSSGSIGKNALWVARRFPEELKIFGLSVHSNIIELAEQIKNHRPEIVCVSDPGAARQFIPQAEKLDVRLLSGGPGLEELASHPDVDIILNSVVGFAGLRATLAAAASGKRIALANKESMVAGGLLVNRAVEVGHAELIPVDSEHSAIFQCLKAGRKNDVKRLILTSSGGPFREYPKEKFGSITVDQALKHPTWKMGPKITIDSATLMNKGLEIIEAVYLFGLPPEKIKVVIHPQSIVHSMVEFVDGSIIAQLSRPDMRVPIQYALFYPERWPLDVADLGFEHNLSLAFEEPDETKFRSLRLARAALETGETAPAVFNAANEVAAAAFLSHRINFPEIFEVVDFTLNQTKILSADSVENIIIADKGGREVAQRFVVSRSV
jgi:1-deoxy-D-xylulose-5-phosphate reductoisomerase